MTEGESAKRAKFRFSAESDGGGGMEGELVQDSGGETSPAVESLDKQNSEIGVEGLTCRGSETKCCYGRGERRG